MECGFLKHLFPQNMVTKILPILSINGNNGRDIFCWPSDKKGEYTISSGYKLMCNLVGKMGRIDGG